MERRARFCNRLSPDKNDVLQGVASTNDPKSDHFQHYRAPRGIFIVVVEFTGFDFAAM
jgi:hypothetical protein